MTGLFLISSSPIAIALSNSQSVPFNFYRIRSIVKMSVLPGPSKLDFIPWDFTSEDHIQRAYLQRFACGWRWWELDDWVKANKAGKMMVYWLVCISYSPAYYI